MNEQDDQWLSRGTPVSFTVLRHSQLPATRRHWILVAVVRITRRSNHHAGSAIRTRWSVFAALAWQSNDFIVVLRHDYCTEYCQDERQGHGKPHLPLLRPAECSERVFILYILVVPQGIKVFSLKCSKLNMLDDTNNTK